MADDPTLDNGSLADIPIAADDAAGKYVQLVKLAYSADGDRTHVSADATGLLVSLGEPIPAGANVIGVVDIGAALPAGTNNIGDVDIASIPASATATDNMGAAAMTDRVMNGLTALTPKFFHENVTASDTDEELVALVTSKKIRVVALVVQAGGTATGVTFESSTTTEKHKVSAGANGGQVLPFNPVGWFETAAGESLTVTTGAGSTVSITGTYVEV